MDENWNCIGVQKFKSIIDKYPYLGRGGGEAVGDYIYLINLGNLWKNPQFNFCSQDPNIERNFFNWDGKVIGEPIGRIHGENEDSYLKLVHKLSLLLAKLDLKVLSTNNLTISNVLKIALKMVALFWFMKHRFFSKAKNTKIDGY